MARNPGGAGPGADDRQSDHRAPDQRFARAAHPRRRGDKGEDRQPDGQPRQRHRQAGQPGQRMGQAGQRLRIGLDHRKDRDAQRGQRPRQHHIGRDAGDQHDHEGPQVAAAEAGKRAKAAIAADGHAIAKDQPAQHRSDRRPGGGKVDRGGGVEPAQRDQHEAAGHGGADGDAPHPQAQVAAGIEIILDRTEGAEPPEPRR